MCDFLARVADDATIPGTNRRRFLQVLGATAASGVVAAGIGMPASAEASSPSSRSRNSRTRLVLLGTAGGPTVIDGKRYGISTAVAYGDQVYVVDLGLGSFIRLRQSSLSGPAGVASTLNNVRSILITHSHSDHLMDWPAVYATGPMNNIGRVGPAIKVFGPGDRGSLPRVFPPQRPAPPVYNPSDPTPGLRGMTGYLRQAWSADFNDRARDSGFVGPDGLFDVQDIDLSGIWAPTPEGIPPRLASPIPIWQDGDVRITATLVDHHANAPAFAYRFDTPDGSVTISGDTTVSPNLIDLARDTDYLVHEVIDPLFVEKLVATLPAAQQEAVRGHLLGAHTTIEQVGRDVAEPAGAKNLVLTHQVPGNNPKTRWLQAKKGYSGRLIVGEDLMELAVGSRSRRR